MPLRQKQVLRFISAVTGAVGGFIGLKLFAMKEGATHRLETVIHTAVHLLGQSGSTGAMGRCGRNR